MIRLEPHTAFRALYELFEHMITNEQLQKELDGFEAQKVQVIAQLHGLEGAISLCRYFLQPKTPEVNPEPDAAGPTESATT